jgi:hypothetical protein
MQVAEDGCAAVLVVFFTTITFSKPQTTNYRIYGCPDPFKTTLTKNGCLQHHHFSIRLYIHPFLSPGCR